MEQQKARQARRLLFNTWRLPDPNSACCRLLPPHTPPCCSWQPGMGQREAQQLAVAIHSLAEQTGGAGNFRFGAAFNCQPGIPFFPAATAAAGCSGFALGTENSALLHEAFQQAAADAAAAAAGEGAAGSDGSVLFAAQACLRSVMTVALQPLEELAQQLAADSGRPYLGIDASIAPALEPPSIPSAYELLRLGRFGGCGTLAVSGWLRPGGRGAALTPSCAMCKAYAACGATTAHYQAGALSAAAAAERITAALKSLPVKLCGYSGLMLPVCEDSGLAEAANDGRISISSLLHYSGARALLAPEVCSPHDCHSVQACHQAGRGAGR